MTQAPSAAAPVVDVLIPAYNAAATIESAVDSIRRQSFRDLLIHVVDDGSTDATPTILARIAAQEPRLRIHRRANGGIVEALNHGLSFCEGEFLARHDADDLAWPERLAVQVGYLRAHADVVAVGARARHIDATGEPTGTYADLDSPDQCDPTQLPSREPYIIHPVLTVRRAALERVGGYRFAVHSEDTDLYWRLHDEGRLVNLPQTLIDYRLHEGSISGGSAANGRVMAVNSQLAAVSARRRAAGRADLDFPKERATRYKQAADLGAVVEIAAEGLDADERLFLARASSAKLLELTSYRPYDVDLADAGFIRSALGDDMAGVDPERRAMLARHLSGTAARLALKGEWRTALRLLPPRLLPGFVARLAMRVAVPARLRRLLQRRGTREALSK